MQTSLTGSSSSRGWPSRVTPQHTATEKRSRLAGTSSNAPSFSSIPDPSNHLRTGMYEPPGLYGARFFLSNHGHKESGSRSASSSAASRVSGFAKSVGSRLAKLPRKARRFCLRPKTSSAVTFSKDRKCASKVSTQGPLGLSKTTSSTRRLFKIDSSRFTAVREGCSKVKRAATSGYYHKLRDRFFCDRRSWESPPPPLQSGGCAGGRDGSRFC